MFFKLIFLLLVDHFIQLKTASNLSSTYFPKPAFYNSSVHAQVGLFMTLMWKFSFYGIISQH